MKNYDKELKLFGAFQEVEDRFLAEAENEKTKAGLEKTKSARQVGMRRWYAAAACIGVLLLFALPATARAIAARWFGLSDFRLPRADELYSETGVSESEGPEESGRTAHTSFPISLSGYNECPESKALAEWLAFQEEYDPDREIMNQIGNDPVELERRYTHYSAYTKEMADKLEEIVQKYGLKLHTKMNVVNPEELVYRVGGEFMRIEQNAYWGYIYEDGTFQYDGTLILDDKTVDMQFGRSVKGTFNEVALYLESDAEYQEIQYVTENGDQVLLALGYGKALILADYDSCFVMMNILGGENCGITVEDLKLTADGIDFAVLTNVRTPEMSGDSENPDAPKIRPFTFENEFVNLGFGWLVFEMPEAGEDYKLHYIPRDPDEAAMYVDADFYDLGIRVDQSAYVFPYVREGNVPIGQFKEFCCFESFKQGTKDAGMFIVGVYEKDGHAYYDTRIYRVSESGWGYELDEEKMRELNERYHDADETYPRWEILEELKR